MSAVNQPFALHLNLSVTIAQFAQPVAHVASTCNFIILKFETDLPIKQTITCNLLKINIIRAFHSCLTKSLAQRTKVCKLTSLLSCGGMDSARDHKMLCFDYFLRTGNKGLEMKANLSFITMHYYTYIPSPPPEKTLGNTSTTLAEREENCMLIMLSFCFPAFYSLELCR